MRYKEVEELEATGEWLVRFNTAGFSDELLYVPSELSKWGIAPIDVVDRLDYLKNVTGRGSAEVDQDTAGVVAPEEPEEPQAEPAPEAPVEHPEKLEEKSISCVIEIAPLVLDYDRYGAWEWAEPIEKMVEDAIAVIFNSEPGLPNFGELASLEKPKSRKRGKRARAATTTAVPSRRANELVSSESVGANV